MTATYHQPAFSGSTRVTDDEIVVYTVRGELDSSTVTAFRQGMAQLVGDRGLVLDMSGVAFVDSAGLGVIVAAVRRMREMAAPIALVVSRPNLARLLHAVGLDRIVTITDDLVDALVDVRASRAASSASA